MDKKQIETTLTIAQAMADELTDYLMSDRLYRQMIVKTPSGARQPKMTLGALLEAIEELHWNEADLTPAQRSQLGAIEEQIAVARGAFHEQWQAHLRRELKSLMDSWRWYLDDAGRDPGARENYPSEAHIRTRIDLVMRALQDDPTIGNDRRELNDMDTRLRAMLRSGNYVGPRGEERRYPADRAWWLYGRPANAD